ncbi:hypothetical protein LTR70_009644 [Exophiala xenobiotica]|uniref:Uncharacterized protein n=1 Tax=Lithohypha guttulata TaxID=1690604 RepID=A0ABR0JY86_9EURO|nr:hypothetical protein LTR24_009339 [Lithohypha guttulata]KAK5310235.1 hypothetical protein LTR70_009644 [Exophiala xenobiotica]
MAPKRPFGDASDDVFTIQEGSERSKKPKTDARAAAPKSLPHERNADDNDHGKLGDAKGKQAVNALSQVKKLTEDNTRLHRELRVLQSKLPPGACSGTNFVQDQSEIMKMFRALKKRIHDFAANYALGGHITRHLSGQNVDMVVRILSGEHPMFQYQALTKINKVPLFSRLIGGPRVGAQSIIEHVVAYEILTRPLHFLPVVMEKTFLEIAARMTKTSENGNLYMGKAVRAIYEDREQYTGTLFKHIVHDMFEDSRIAYYDRLTDVCLNRDTGLLKLLLKSPDEKTAQRQTTLLRGIFMAAGKLSLQMCVQDIIVMPRGLKAVGLNRCFQPGPQNLELHTIVKSVAGDTALYRNNIGLVVSPQLTYARFEASGRRPKATTVCKAEVVPFVEEKLFSEDGKSVALISKSEGLVIDEPSSSLVTTSSLQAAESTLGRLRDAAARRAKQKDETNAPHALAPEQDRNSSQYLQVSSSYLPAFTALIENVQGGCVNDTIVDSQLLRRSPPGSNFRIPVGVEPIILDDDDDDDDDAGARWNAETRKRKPGARQASQETQQGFELPELVSNQFDAFAQITSDSSGIGRPDQQAGKTAEGGQSLSAYETSDQKQSGGGNSERAQWHHSAPSNSKGKQEEAQAEQVTESSVEGLANSVGSGCGAAEVINAAHNATEHGEDDTARSSSAPHAAPRDIDAELAEEPAKIDKLLAETHDPLPSRKVEVARVVRRSTGTPSAFHTTQEAPQQCTAEEMMPDCRA